MYHKIWNDWWTDKTASYYSVDDIWVIAIRHAYIPFLFEQSIRSPQKWFWRSDLVLVLWLCRHWIRKWIIMIKKMAKSCEIGCRTFPNIYGSVNWFLWERNARFNARSGERLRYWDGLSFKQKIAEKWKKISWFEGGDIINRSFPWEFEKKTYFLQEVFLIRSNLGLILLIFQMRLKFYLYD